MGKEVGSAEVYAPPHKMNGKPLVISSNPGKDMSTSSDKTLNMSVGSIGRNDKTVKTDGIKVRGTGAATKGILARGPMA